MKYAVITASGSQFIAEEGKPLVLDLLDKKEGDTVEFDQVLLLVNDDKVTVGKPHIGGLKVIGEVVKHYKGDKIRVVQFRAKSRYRKARGFRPSYSDVLIKDIQTKQK